MTQTITIKDPAAPATDKQIAFLTSLVKDRECPAVAEKFRFSTKIGFLAKGAASGLIDEALKAPKKKHQTFAAPASPVLPSAAEVMALTELPEFGYYLIDGKVFYWDVTGKDAFPVLRQLTKVTSYTGAVKGSWKKHSAPYAEFKTAPKVTGTWTPYAGKSYITAPVTKTVTVPKVLAEAVQAGAKPMSMTQAATQGHVMGFCIRCGATLTDPQSVADGIGPVCKTYWS